MNTELTFQNSEAGTKSGDCNIEEASWEVVREWTHWAIKYKHGALGCQVMAGFGLVALHDRLGIRRGRKGKRQGSGDAGVERALRWKTRRKRK
jgi:hypothetical protein